MEQFRNLPLGRQLMLGGGLLLLIDTFLPWQQISILGFSHSWTAWHGFWGVVLGLATIILVAWLAARALDIAVPVELPEGLTALVLAGVILAFAVIKNIADDYSAWGSYLGIVLAAVVAYGAWLNFAASGESLPARSAADPGPSSAEETAPEAPASGEPV